MQLHQLPATHGCGSGSLRPVGVRTSAVRGPCRSRRRLPVAAAHNRGRSSSTYYELLGLEPGCSDAEIKAAFRRRAKELHPDVNTEADAEASFIEVSTAYETLSDEGKRRAYDRLHGFGVQRLNFFQDVEVEVNEAPFSWQRRRYSSSARPGDEDEYGDIVGDDDEDAWPQGDSHSRGFGRKRGGGGFGWRDLGSDPEDEEEEEEEGEAAGGPGRETAAEAEARRLEALLRVLGRMGGRGGLTMRDWGAGRMDPWGSGTSEMWHRRVQQQTSDPFANRGRYGQGAPPARQPLEWGPPQRGDDEGGGGGSGPPGRGVPGWVPPNRRWGEEEEGRGGGGGWRWGDDGFSGRPL